MSLFTAVEMAPRDPILGLNEQFGADTNPAKVNLGVGVYYDDGGKIPLLGAVREAERLRLEAAPARGYLPIEGIAGDETRTVRPGDIAEVHRGYAEPAAPRIRYMGDDAIGIAVSMKRSGDILQLGKVLDAETVRLQRSLPVGMQLRRIADQPAAVRDSVVADFAAQFRRYFAAQGGWLGQRLA